MKIKVNSPQGKDREIIDHDVEVIMKAAVFFIFVIPSFHIFIYQCSYYGYSLLCLSAIAFFLLAGEY
jgi:hypothetical protein